ncbi:hypothetical protein [Lactobacillus delbrueckii]|uniref:hypothetical protein n=2 Tax=Lactobacillus delbrueckii TaxID=1584 RepID=UPI001BFFA171|nr:hypothetical protein [Lactobacillus delbrueckii]
MEAEMDKIKGREYKLPKRYEHYFKLTYHKDKLYGYEEREDVIERELQLCGYFSEKLFDSDKTFFGNRSFRVASSQATEAKVHRFDNSGKNLHAFEKAQSRNAGQA